MTNLLRSLSALLLLCGLCACSSLQKTLPRPALGQHEWTSYDNKVMPYSTWVDPQGEKPRGIVIAVHGLGGATTDFWFMGDQVARNGYTVYAYEMRGQGLDPVTAERGDIKTSRQWLRDLETFHLLVRRKHPGLPVFWYGESLGSLVCLHTAAARLSDRRDPDGVVVGNPVAGLRVSVSGFRRALLNAAATLAPKTRFSLGELSGVEQSKIRMTNDTTFNDESGVTKHQIKEFTLRLLAEIGHLIDHNPSAAKRLRMPVLFMASPNDVIASPDQVQALFSQVRSPRKKLLWYTRSYHLLLQDVQKKEVTQDLLSWLDTRVQEVKTTKQRARAFSRTVRTADARP
jgi:alpha-beta hydrolase superfamily lysophospholipase